MSEATLEEVRAMQTPSLRGVTAMARTAETTGEGLERLWRQGIEDVPADDFGIEFGLDGIEVPDIQASRTSPRFRVDRPPPPSRYPFVPRGAIVEDGDYVGRGVADRGMTIAEVRAAARQQAQREMALAEMPPAPPISTRVEAAPQQPVRVPTLRDRLIGGMGPLD
jgi:hypothetical protein